MTLHEIVKIQSVIDNRSIATDTLQILEKKRFSKSKNKEIKIGDMHIDHFLRSLNLVLASWTRFSPNIITPCDKASSTAFFG